MAACGLDEIRQLLDSVDRSALSSIFPSIISSRAFEFNSTGTCAQLVLTFTSGPDGSIWCSEFMRFLFSCESKALKRTALEFFLLWLRSSGPDSLDSQIEALESFAPQIKQLLEQDNSYYHSRLIIAQLLDRCSLHVLPGPTPSLSGVHSARDFLSVSPHLVRSRRAAELRGRLHLLSSRIFPPFADFALSKRCVQVVQTTRGDSPVPTALERIAGGWAGPLEFQTVDQFMARATCVELRNRVPRPPPRVLASFETIQSLGDAQDPEVCLQIAIMCAIVSEEKERFFRYILKFAGLCKVDGEVIIKILHQADTDVTKRAAEARGDPDEADDSEKEPFEPLLKPFEVVHDDGADAEPQIREEVPAEVEIRQFAGPDPEKWFDGEEINEWRAARLCVAHLMDRLDPDSFAVLPLK
jgi:hypothetical protein